MPIKPFSPYRTFFEHYTHYTKQKSFLQIWQAFDVTVFQEAVQEARKLRVRPPSIVAYCMRCLGKVLRDYPEMLAVQRGRKLYIPDHVNVSLILEGKSPDQTWIPMNWVFERMEEKTLPAIEQEVKKAAQKYRREGIHFKGMSLINKFVQTPFWIQRVIEFMWRPLIKRLLNRASSHVGFTSLANLPAQTLSFGTPLPYFTLNLTLGTMASEGDQWKLGALFSFDALVIEHRSIEPFLQALYQEIKSGSCLKERETA